LQIPSSQESYREESESERSLQSSSRGQVIKNRKEDVGVDNKYMVMLGQPVSTTGKKKKKKGKGKPEGIIKFGVLIKDNK
jgi:hypothetical protein